MVANQITKIKVNKKNYILKINDNEYIIDEFYYNSLLAYEGKVLEVKTMLQLIAFAKANPILSKTYKNIFNHTISYFDFKNKLRKNEIDERSVSLITSFFIEEGYLDDNDFVKRYKEAYERSKGINKFKRLLEQKHIPQRIINAALLDYTENFDVAMHYANTFIKNKVSSNAMLKQKIKVNLINKGYSKALVNEVLEQLVYKDETINLKKDIQKYKQKYPNDYYKLLNKLIACGYNSNDIKALLKEETLDED